MEKLIVISAPSGGGKTSLNKLKSVTEENFQMVEDQGNGIWISQEEGHRPIDWINTMKFLCE